MPSVLLGASRHFHDSTTEGVTPGIAGASRTVLTGACPCPTGWYFYLPWHLPKGPSWPNPREGTAKPNISSLPFKSHVMSETWESGSFPPLKPPASPTAPAQGSPCSVHHHSRALPPPSRASTTHAQGHYGQEEGQGTNRVQGDRPRAPSAGAAGPTLSDMRVAMERPSSW